MYINFMNCSESILDALKQLQKNTELVISDQGVPVELITMEQGLSITRNLEGIKLQYSTLNTLFRGVLLILTNQSVEEYRIVQNCSFEDFGIMVDLSRNAVLTVDTLKDLVRHIALLGYRSLQLYTEDTLVVEQEDYFGYMRGSLKGEEIRELDDYCKQFGIELIPCIQCLAHLRQILRYERYDRIIDTDDILLAGEEKTYILLDHIFKTVSDHFSSRKINIGMDEAHMIGLGKYLDRHGYENRFDIMLKHLNRVKEICSKYGFEPRMWSDMFFRLVYGGDYYQNNITADKEEIFKLIPKDIMLIYWDYYSCDYRRYADNLNKHLSISENVGFAGGAWKWTGFTPDNDFSMKTGEASVRACKDQKIKSFLLTCWGDNGAEASIFSILPAIYYYAEKAYTDQFEKDGFRTLTGVGFDEYMRIDIPNRLEGKGDKHNNASKFFLYNDLLIGTFDSLASEQLHDMYKDYANELKQISPSTGRYRYLFDTMQLLCEVLYRKVNLGNELKRAYDNKDIQQLSRMKDEVLPELINTIKEFYQCFNRQWHKENKSFGFEVQCIRFGGLINRVEYTIERLRKYIDHEIDVVEELEEVRRPFAYFEVPGPQNLTYNLWSNIVTPNVI